MSDMIKNLDALIEYMNDNPAVFGWKSRYEAAIELAERLERENAALRELVEQKTIANLALIEKALICALSDSYDCTRHWSAWSYGTMSQDDFKPCGERITEIMEEITVELDAAKGGK